MWRAPTSDHVFVEELRRRGFERQRVRGDGECLYRSLCLSLPNIMPSDPRDLRSQLAAYMRTHRDQFQRRLKEQALDDKDDPQDPRGNIDSAIIAIETTGIWGGEVALSVAAELFNIEIRIHQPGAPVVRIEPVDTRTRAGIANIVYDGSKHYDLAVVCGESSHDSTPVNDDDEQYVVRDPDDESILSNIDKTTLAITGGLQRALIHDINTYLWPHIVSEIHRNHTHQGPGTTKMVIGETMQHVTEFSDDIPKWVHALESIIIADVRKRVSLITSSVRNKSRQHVGGVRYDEPKRQRVVLTTHNTHNVDYIRKGG